MGTSAEVWLQRCQVPFAWNEGLLQPNKNNWSTFWQQCVNVCDRTGSTWPKQLPPWNYDLSDVDVGVGLLLFPLLTCKYVSSIPLIFGTTKLTAGGQHQNPIHYESDSRTLYRIPMCEIHLSSTMTLCHSPNIDHSLLRSYIFAWNKPARHSLPATMAVLSVH